MICLRHRTTHYDSFWVFYPVEYSDSVVYAHCAQHITARACCGTAGAEYRFWCVFFTIIYIYLKFHSLHFTNNLHASSSIAKAVIYYGLTTPEPCNYSINSTMGTTVCGSGETTRGATEMQRVYRASLEILPKLVNSDRNITF